MSDRRDFLRAEVYPRLSARAVYDHPAHRVHGRGTLRGGCPFHDSASGTSFTITEGDPDFQFWCGGCAGGGDAVTYVHSLRVGRIE
ncbi:hypothetical protein, partial [Rubrivirga sp.]|uniref:hypothetical protein n=1 Tax=Rubrivirga sp. TaxID=1885344 RepID=UPI003C780CD2